MVGPRVDAFRVRIVHPPSKAYNGMYVGRLPIIAQVYFFARVRYSGVTPRRVGMQWWTERLHPPPPLHPLTVRSRRIALVVSADGGNYAHALRSWITIPRSSRTAGRYGEQEQRMQGARR